MFLTLLKICKLKKKKTLKHHDFIKKKIQIFLKIFLDIEKSLYNVVQKKFGKKVFLHC